MLPAEFSRQPPPNTSVKLHLVGELRQTEGDQYLLRGIERALRIEDGR